MDWINRIFNLESENNFKQTPRFPNRNTCQKCANMTFTYDPYWDETCCNNCGYTVPGNFVDKKDKEKPKFEFRVQQKKGNEIFEFSHSKISLFEKCQKAYYFKYIKLKEESFSTIEQHLGKSIHKALQESYLKKANGSEVSLSYLMACFDRAWSSPVGTTLKIVKKNMTSDHYHAEGMKMITYFHNNILSIDNSKTIALEKYFEIPLDVNIIYRGYIDRISQFPNGKFRLTDYKTGKHVEHPLNDMQLRSYTLWFFNEFDKEEVEIAYDAIKLKKTFSCSVKKAHESVIKNKILTDIKMILSIEKYKATKSILCHWCGYNHMCKDALKLSQFR